MTDWPGPERRPPAGLVVLRYVLLVVTMAAVLAAFWVLFSAWQDTLGAAFARTSGVSAAYQRSLFEKVFIIFTGIAAVAVIVVCEWYYLKAPVARDLLRRFSRVCSLVALLLSACHAVSWLLGGLPGTLTLLLAGGELLLGAALLALSFLRARDRSTLPGKRA